MLILMIFHTFLNLDFVHSKKKTNKQTNVHKESFKIVQSDGNLFSANYLIKFQPQFKPPSQGLQGVTKMGLKSVLGWWITKFGNSGLQSVLGVG